MKKIIEIGKTLSTLLALALLQIISNYYFIGSNKISQAFPPAIIVGLIGLATTVAGGAIKGSQAKKASSATYKQKLIDDAVAARKAQEEAKKNKKLTDTLLVIGASLTLLGISVAIYLRSLPKAIKAS